MLKEQIIPVFMTDYNQSMARTEIHRKEDSERFVKIAMKGLKKYGLLYVQLGCGEASFWRQSRLFGVVHYRTMRCKALSWDLEWLLKSEDNLSPLEESEIPLKCRKHGKKKYRGDVATYRLCTGEFGRKLLESEESFRTYGMDVR